MNIQSKNKVQRLIIDDDFNSHLSNDEKNINDSKD